MKPSQATIIFFIKLQLASACYTPFKNISSDYYDYTPFKNISFDYYDYPPFFKNISSDYYDYDGHDVDACTITCSNLYSLSDIFYDYYEDDDCYEYNLTIAESNVTVIHSQDFTKFKTIGKLYMAGIHIEEIQPGAFTELTQLRELHLQNNHLRRLSNGMLESLTRLVDLDLGNNTLSHIEAMAFSKLTSLEFLDLHQNRLTTLEDNLFANLKHLRFLNLAQNPLLKLTIGNIPSLDVLNIAQLSLTDIDFRGDRSMFYNGDLFINMSSNPLKTLDCNRLPKTSMLDLSNDQLVNLYNTSNLESEKIYLNNNRLKSVEGLKSVFYLYLAHNEIEAVNKKLIKESVKLIGLDLSYNTISLLEEDSFGNSVALTGLLLQHNKISKIPRNLFQNTTRLELIDLSFNRIEELQYGTFNNLPQLEYLNVGHNRIKNLPQYVLSSLSKLNTLRFDFNNISTLHTKDLTDHIPSLKTVSLDGNNWECKQLVQIYHDFKSSKVEMDEGSVYDSENFKGIVCHKNESSKLDDTVTSDKIASGINKVFNETFANLIRLLNKKYNSTVKHFPNVTEFVKIFNDYKKDLKQMAMQESGKEIEESGAASSILILNVALQIIMCCLMAIIFFTIFRFFRKERRNSGLPILENIE